MKKTLSAILIVAMLVTALSVVSFAADSFDYAHIVASGNDPYGTLTLSETIDPANVKWAAIKYRTVTQKDNTGVDLLGQIYISPAAEPFIPVVWNHTQKWETVVVDLTSVSKSTTLESVWAESGGTAIRFDPIESNRDAEANQSEADTAVVSDGDCIDVAYIAFFDSEAKAKAFNGTGTDYAAIIDAAALAGIGTVTGDNKVSAELKTETGAAPATGDFTAVIAVVAVLSLGVVVVTKKVRA